MEARIAAARAEARDTIAHARTTGTRLEARAIRRPVRELSAGGDTPGLGRARHGAGRPRAPGPDAAGAGQAGDEGVICIYVVIGQRLSAVRG